MKKVGGKILIVHQNEYMFVMPAGFKRASSSFLDSRSTDRGNDANVFLIYEPLVILI